MTENTEFVHDGMESLEDDLTLWLERYRHANDVQTDDDHVRISVDADAHFHDKDAIIGVVVRKWNLTFVDENENEYVDETFLHFRRD